ncbi:DUF1642 domain-containing protein [Ligilactobacillus apodemi]|uniref:DUF1642 domain-containing protein n=1 Tax=Ligilactobacillus apodemi TaxID=307126 RepID=UPI00214B5DF3|nr:DUF1642 domain-containing protein [Ligilactobacillus apodemi]MCR1901628.1 DUF1642 domain-containing protein [Ligilactobacillus apodemi]
MTEEKDFWIDKDEVSALSNAEGTVYKVTQKAMNQKGWYKLADDEQIVKIVELTQEDADFVEDNMGLPFYDLKEPLSYINSLHDYVNGKNVKRPRQLLAKLAKAYFNGYTIKKEKKYYIKLNFDFSRYLNIQENGVWWFTNGMPTILGRSQFTQTEIDEMQKDPRAKGLDLNALKVEVHEDELED